MRAYVTGVTIIAGLALLGCAFFMLSVFAPTAFSYDPTLALLCLGMGAALVLLSLIITA